MQQQGIRSTKPRPAPIDPAIPIATLLDIAPAQEPQNAKTNDVYVTIFSEDDVKKSYSDQTGKFPHQSSRGNEYVFILYNYDSNSIHAVPIPNRQAATIRDAWVTTFKKLRYAGYAPYIHFLDNECSTILQDAFEKYIDDYQIVPPHVHRRNAAERAIQT